MTLTEAAKILNGLKNGLKFIDGPNRRGVVFLGVTIPSAGRGYPFSARNPKINPSVHYPYEILRSRPGPVSLSKKLRFFSGRRT
jgi:hypothetical protein